MNKLHKYLGVLIPNCTFPAACSPARNAIAATSAGMLGSSVSGDSGCGAASGRWLVTAGRGQRIRFMLYVNVTSRAVAASGGDNVAHAHCDSYAILSDTLHDNEVKVNSMCMSSESYPNFGDKSSPW